MGTQADTIDIELPRVDGDAGCVARRHGDRLLDERRRAATAARTRHRRRSRALCAAAPVPGAACDGPRHGSSRARGQRRRTRLRFGARARGCCGRRRRDRGGIWSSVDVYGHSYGGECVFGAALLTANIRRLVFYEGWPPVTPEKVYFPRDVEERLDRLVADGDRDAALEFFMREVAEVSDAEIRAIRAQPSWPMRVGAVHTISREFGRSTRTASIPSRRDESPCPYLWWPVATARMGSGTTPRPWSQPSPPRDSSSSRGSSTLQTSSFPRSSPGISSRSSASSAAGPIG